MAGVGPHPEGDPGEWLEIDVDRDVREGVEPTGPESRVGISVYTPVGDTVELLRS